MIDSLTDPFVGGVNVEEPLVIDLRDMPSGLVAEVAAAMREQQLTEQEAVEVVIIGLYNATHQPRVA